MQGSHRGRGLLVINSTSNISSRYILLNKLADSRPNTAPAGTSEEQQLHQLVVVVVHHHHANGGTLHQLLFHNLDRTSSGPKGGPIQMSAFTNILANLG